MNKVVRFKPEVRKECKKVSSQYGISNESSKSCFITKYHLIFIDKCNDLCPLKKCIGTMCEDCKDDHNCDKIEILDIDK